MIMSISPKNPHPANSTEWWIFDRIAGRRAFIASQRDDIERAERNIREAEAVIEALEADAAALAAGRSAREVR